MKKLLTFVFIVFMIQGFAQQKADIDSVNLIPYKVKLEKANTLEAVFLKNAQDAKHINYRLGEADSYSNLGLIYYVLGKYEKDFQYSLKAISIYESLGAKEKLASEYGEMGYKIKRRNFEKALFYMQKAKRIAELNHFQKPLLSIYNNYGVLKEMQQQFDSALYFYNKGLLIKERTNDSIGIPYSLNNIAGIYVIRKEFNKAKPLFDRALDIRMRLKDAVGIMENYTAYGDFYAAQNNPKEAILWYEKALQKAQESHYINFIQNSYKRLSEQYEVLKNEKAALYNFKMHAQYKDSLLNKDTNAKIAELEVKFETNKKEKQLIENKNQLLQKEIEVKNAKYFSIGIILFALFLGLIGFLLLRQQKLKNRQQEQEFQLKSAIAQIESQNQLQEQRLTISRDLHDNIGAQLTFIISSVDNIKYAFDIQNPKLDGKLQNISSFTKSTIVELRDTIWAMNSNEITFEDLRARILNFIENAKTATENIDFQFSIDEDLNQLELTSVIGMNLYRTLQEAVNNALKYADPTKISIAVKKIENALSLEIQDDGVGFDTETVAKGNGLLNMQNRIESLGGIFTLHTELGKGTSISILLQL